MKFHKSSEKFPKNIQSLIIKVAKTTNLPKHYWKIHNYLIFLDLSAESSYKITTKNDMKHSLKFLLN